MSTTTQDTPQYGVEKAAVRKVIYRLAALDGSDVDPEDTSMIEAANDALRNVEDIARRLEAAEERIDDLENRAPDPESKDYDAMDKADKATVVRSKLRREAESTSGAASVKYKDVIRTFDGRPSSGHAYDIMAAAASADGFEYGEAPDGTKRLTFDRQKTEA